MIKLKFPKNLTNFTLIQCRLCSSHDTTTKTSKDLAKKNNEVQEKYDPKEVTKEEMEWRTPSQHKGGQYYNFLKTFYTDKSKRNWLQIMQQPIDLSPSSIKQWWTKRDEEVDIFSQSYIPQRNQILGNELAAAHFIVFRGGAVKFFNEDEWIRADKKNEFSLPRFYEEGKTLEAIDCSDMNLYYEGLVNLRDLKQVEWLSFNGCETIDDWCMDTISNIFSHSLIYLDLRNCPKISEKGIGTLYKMRKLKVLYLDDFFRSTTYEMTCLLLQEVNPSLDIRSDPVVF